MKKEVKQSELRKKIDELLKYCNELDLRVANLDIDINTESVLTIGEAIPEIILKEWRVSIDLRAPLEV